MGSISLNAKQRSHLIFAPKYKSIYSQTPVGAGNAALRNQEIKEVLPFPLGASRRQDQIVSRTEEKGVQYFIQRDFECITLVLGLP